MSQQKPAFPSTGSTYGGLTKREYFAGQALMGLQYRSIDAAYVARQAVAMADALIAELEKTNG